MITYTIGRASDNDIIIDMENVSSYHAYLKYYEGNKAVIEDRQSVNGVWVNNRRVQSCLINFNDQVLLAGNQFDLKKYFRYFDGVILEPKSPDDYTDKFLDLVKFEDEFEKELDNINRKSSRNMIYFRLSLVLATFCGLSLRFINKDWSFFIIIVMVFLGLISVYFYSKAMAASRKKEKDRKIAREDFKLKYSCPSCNNHIPDSTYMMKMKTEYNCRYCKVKLYKKSVQGIGM